MSKPFCRKCLFEDIDPNGIYLEIKDMIAALPQEKKADDELYRRRLQICSECDQLGEGTCCVCGCFAELRAAKKDMSCPHENKYW